MPCLKIGHRGMRGCARENTVPGAMFAFIHGMDAVEIDIRKTIDNEIFLYHNKLIKTTACEVPVDTLTFEELKDCDSNIITLYSFLKKIPINKGKIFFDIKKCDSDLYFMKTFMNIIKFFLSTGWNKDNFYYQSYHAIYIDILGAYDNIFSNRGILYDGLPLDYFHDLHHVNATYICINWCSIDKTNISYIKNTTNFKIYLFTINSKLICDKFKSLVDGIITDYYTVLINLKGIDSLYVMTLILCDKVLVKEIRGKGLGVFASQDIKKNDLIEKGIIKRIDSDGNNNPHLFSWSEDGTVWGFGSGCSTFYNASRNPNTEMFRYYDNDTFEIFALKDIKKGEEVVHKYKSLEWRAAFKDLRKMKNL